MWHDICYLLLATGYFLNKCLLHSISQIWFETVRCNSPYSVTFRFSSKILWLTLSKAFWKSRNTPQVNYRYYKALLISSVMIISAWLVEWTFLKPNCFVAIKTFIFVEEFLSLIRGATRNFYGQERFLGIRTVQ